MGFELVEKSNICGEKFNFPCLAINARFFKLSKAAIALIPQGLYHDRVNVYLDKTSSPKKILLRFGAGPQAFSMSKHNGGAFTSKMIWSQIRDWMAPDLGPANKDQWGCVIDLAWSKENSGLWGVLSENVAKAVSRGL